MCKLTPLLLVLMLVLVSVDAAAGGVGLTAAFTVLLADILYLVFE